MIIQQYFRLWYLAITFEEVHIYEDITAKMIWPHHLKDRS